MRDLCKVVSYRCLEGGYWMIREREWDCLVVGGGPVGSTVAWKLAEKGRSVLMIEKRQEIGVPVRCGEGISRQLLDMLGIEPDPSWISSEMDGAIVVSPSGHELELGPEIAGPEVGYVIKRDMFDQALARRAVRAGAMVEARAEALSMERSGEEWIVKIGTIEGEIEVKTKIVVAADGFESTVSRWAGINTRLPPKDIDTCIQYEMVGIETRGRFTEFFLGKNIAPGGYLWCFPKGDDIANVGIGINGAMMKEGADPKRYLDSFIRRMDRFSKGSITEINGGGVSVSLPLERTVADSFLVVGDAARMIDPLTGGGVYNGCCAAIEAARTIDEALEKGDTSEKGLEPYERRWREKLEAEMARNYLAKEKMLSVSDEVLDKVIEAISGYDLRDITTEELLKAVASRYPEVLEEILL
jgi:digeranylgeranylglycerophospholipid reductase